MLHIKCKRAFNPKHQGGRFLCIVWPGMTVGRKFDPDRNAGLGEFVADNIRPAKHQIRRGKPLL